MNRFELEHKLLEEGYDPRSLFISKTPHPLDEGLIVYIASNGDCMAESQDRGNRMTFAQGASEDIVCQEIYDKLSPLRRRDRMANLP